ncbi:hypothetical protein DNR46_28250 [Mesorhizobium japonicum]|nr:hypothetical protein DNR46_28250 [Mesorhizobium japonicum]
MASSIPADREMHIACHTHLQAVTDFPIPALHQTMGHSGSRRRDALMRADGLGTGQSIDDRHSLRRTLIQKLVVLRELEQSAASLG